ncbi:MAG: hypothetical protein A3K19_05215 [Lentisphaerae bacterium RIFOXYB12_FULL_65_16]|nr:MAG: hypothetical protein A3K18_02625 [Lentisphaerae bacterium RIFOXYA12_64_32]OGV84158.1 MAG: hypothetical protein A3K19_05215 [Lentisphaerae bacterium RIFOXYB12_FULL_65_16]
MKAYRVLVRGVVTGVGFRYSARREAAHHEDLQGYVRNADMSTVECVVQGTETDVNAMLAWLRHGPSSARVTSCDIEPLAVDPERPAFGITH